MPILDKNAKLALEKLASEIPAYEFEGFVMDRKFDDVHSCITGHFMSKNDFNKSWLLNRMRNILYDSSDLPSYTSGIMYAELIGRGDLADELKDEIKEDFLFGGIYTSILSLYLKIHNPFA
jgi:hypothetical protein